MVDEDDLKVDVFRSRGGDGSGAWGVRITHIPSGTEALAQGTFEAGDNPQAAIDEAAKRLRAEIDAELQDA